MRTMRGSWTVAVGLAVLATGIAAAPAAAETVMLRATLSGVKQVPPAESRGTGVGEVTYDTVTRVLVWTVTFSGTTGPIMAAHFHGPAETDANAGPVVVMQGLVSPLTGTAVLTPDQAADMLTGLWYINLHTAQYPGGEIRGQVVKP